MTKPTSNSTPLFPDFHMRTLSRKRRSRQQILVESHRKLMESSFLQWFRILDGFLPGSILRQNESECFSRKRFFTKANTFLAFLGQVLHDDGSCQDTVHRLREQGTGNGERVSPCILTFDARNGPPILVFCWTHSAPPTAVGFTAREGGDRGNLN